MPRSVSSQIPGRRLIRANWQFNPQRRVDRDHTEHDVDRAARCWNHRRRLHQYRSSAGRIPACGECKHGSSVATRSERCPAITTRNEYGRCSCAQRAQVRAKACNRHRQFAPTRTGSQCRQLRPSSAKRSRDGSSTSGYSRGRSTAGSVREVRSTTWLRLDTGLLALGRQLPPPCMGRRLLCLGASRIRLGARPLGTESL